MTSMRSLAPLCLLLGLAGGCSSASRIPIDNSTPDSGTTTGPDAGGTSTSCATNADCRSSPNTPICDVVGGACVACLLDAQCPTDETCKHDHLCHGTKACMKDDDCNAISTCGPEKTCIATPGRCLGGRDCLDPLKKQCDSSALVCVSCLTSSDCGGNGVGQCQPDHTCVLQPGRCLQESDCANTSGASHCDTTSERCVECAHNSDCPSNYCSRGICAPLGTCLDSSGCVNVPGKPQCYTASHQCVQCLQGTDCPSGTCNSHQCTAAGSCTSNAQCANQAGTPKCETSSMQCVQCLQNTDCSTGTCVGNQCQSSGCTSDSSCAGMTGRPHCSSSGACVQCTTNSQCATGQTCSAGTCQSGMMTGTTCNQIVVCQNACMDNTCTSNCFAAGTPAAQSAVNALVNCLFGTGGACPASGGGVCDSTAAGYNATNCGNCLMTAQSPTGACSSQVATCQAT